MGRILFICCTICCCYLCQAQTSAVTAEKNIRAARAASNAAIAQHDAEGIVKYVSDDFIMVTGNAQQFIGKDAVLTRWRAFFEKNPQVLYVRTPTQITISKNDTLAWETGRWKATNSYSAGGNYSAMWCKRNGVLLTRTELFVSLEK